MLFPHQTVAVALLAVQLINVQKHCDDWPESAQSLLTAWHVFPKQQTDRSIFNILSWQMHPSHLQKIAIWYLFLVCFLITLVLVYFCGGKVNENKLEQSHRICRACHLLLENTQCVGVFGNSFHGLKQHPRSKKGQGGEEEEEQPLRF